MANCREKEEKKKKITFKISKWTKSPSVRGGWQPWDHQAAPTSNVHIDSPGRPSLLDSSSFYLQHLTQNLQFPTKHRKTQRKRPSNGRRAGETSSNPQPSNQKPSWQSTNPKKQNNKKTLGPLQPITRRPLKHFLKIGRAHV